MDQIIYIFIGDLGIGDWGLWCCGCGGWGWGIAPNPKSPIPNPQSPIPISLLNYNKKFIMK